MHAHVCDCRCGSAQGFSVCRSMYVWMSVRECVHGFVELLKLGACMGLYGWCLFMCLCILPACVSV